MKKRLAPVTAAISSFPLRIVPVRHAGATVAIESAGFKGYLEGRNTELDTGV
jgi:hypothetical protein